jgi:hypothetical protein
MTRDELLAAYESGRRNFGGADLTGADLNGADLTGADLTGADLNVADLTGADLRGANLRGADLDWANLSGANLGWANLSGANLSGANLSGANLSGAYLSGVYLRDQWIIQGGVRSDGYHFLLQKLTQDSEPMVKAGCRYFTLPEAHKHWRQTRGGTQLGLETFAILDSLEALAKARGLI